MIAKEVIIDKLKKSLNSDNYIIGSVIGSGISFLNAVNAGVDFTIVLSSGKYRQMGRGSLSSFLCYENSNDLVMNIGMREILPLSKDIPIFFGLNATDPTKDLYSYIKEIKEVGFSGINNFPSVGLIDGKFSEALEERGISYEREIEAIRIANFLNLFTIAFVFNEKQAIDMINAGADVICVHFGLTMGGYVGAKKAILLKKARNISQRIFNICDKVKTRKIIKMVYGGPIQSPIDLKYVYENNSCQGFIGGSVFDRIPTERGIFNTVKAFRICSDNMKKKIKTSDSVGDYIKEYIEKNYMKQIKMKDLASALNISNSYLSGLFKKKFNWSFSEYLIRYRIEKFVELVKNGDIKFNEAAEIVGYDDYAQFSKQFKKYTKMSPKEYFKQ